MTNQTIDGVLVSRELLEDSWAALLQKGQVIRALQLRELLDAPAAQPQGEPVAYLDLEKIQPGGMAYATKMRVNHRQTALYAEQPAPVAVVLPERPNGGL